jgi:hypothetical protein
MPGTVSVYWLEEAELPPDQVLEDDPARRPVSRLGIANDGDGGWLLLLFDDRWEERNDLWFESRDEALREAAAYGVGPEDWVTTGATWERRFDRALP